MNNLVKLVKLNWHPVVIATGGVATYGCMCYHDTIVFISWSEICKENSHVFQSASHGTPNYGSNIKSILHLCFWRCDNTFKFI